MKMKCSNVRIGKEMLDGQIEDKISLLLLSDGILIIEIEKVFEL